MAEVQQARNWFYTNDCAITCDYVGTTRDHIQKLYNKLSGRWKSGLLTKDELRFAIREGGHTVGAGVVTEIIE